MNVFVCVGACVCGDGTAVDHTYAILVHKDSIPLDQWFSNIFMSNFHVKDDFVIGGSTFIFIYIVKNVQTYSKCSAVYLCIYFVHFVLTECLIWF